MNASLRRISVTVMALIVLLLLNATYTQVFTADGLRADPRNQRVLLDEVDGDAVLERERLGLGQAELANRAGDRLRVPEVLVGEREVLRRRGLRRRGGWRRMRLGFRGRGLGN